MRVIFSPPSPHAGVRGLLGGLGRDGGLGVGALPEGDDAGGQAEVFAGDHPGVGEDPQVRLVAGGFGEQAGQVGDDAVGVGERLAHQGRQVGPERFGVAAAHQSFADQVAGGDPFAAGGRSGGPAVPFDDRPTVGHHRREIPRVGGVGSPNPS